MSWMGKEGTSWETLEIQVLCTRVGRQVTGSLEVAGQETLAWGTTWKLPPAPTCLSRLHLTTNQHPRRS